MKLAPGMIFNNRYEILESLGEGGFAIVWKAKDKELDRLVAIKLLKIQVGDPDSTAELKQRLRREARILSSLDHPNIVKVFAIDFLDDTVAYIVMEFLTGEPLSKLIGSQGKLACGLIKELTKQTCAGLGYAHSNGMIHRDLSSANLFLWANADRKTVKIIDFGLSKSDQSTSTNITKTGLLVGNPAYMSPESILGNKPDSRADIYSLGCIIYEMATGLQPFQTDNVVGLLFKHQNEFPQVPSYSSAELDDGLKLNAIILRCIQKERELRFASCEEVSAVLDADISIDDILPQTLNKELVRNWTSESAKPKPAGSLRAIAPGIGIVTIALLLLVLLFSSFKAPTINSSKLSNLSELQAKNNKTPIASLASKKKIIESAQQRQRINKLRDPARIKSGDPRQLYKKILDQQIKDTGLWSFDHLLTYQELAQFEREQEKFDDMEKYCQIIIEHTRSPSKPMDEQLRKELLTSALLMIAQSYWDRSQPDKSEPFALQALKSANPLQTQVLEVLLGDIKLSQRKFNEAKIYYSRVTVESEPHIADVYYMGALLGLSSVFAHNGSLLKAEQLQSRAADLAESKQLFPHYSQRLFDLGMRFYFIGEFDDAERLYYASLAKILPNGESDYIGHADLHWLGELYFKRGEMDKAEIKFKEVLAYEKKKGIRSWRGDNVIDSLKSIYEKAKNKKGLEDLEVITQSRSHLPKT